jgi:hypothetical protein
MKAESEILEAALALPADARERLLEKLSASLDGVEPELTAEMERELIAREAGIRAGRSVDVETFLSRGRAAR